MLQGTQAAEGDAVLLMPQDFAVAEEQAGSLLHMEIISRAELERCSRWPLAFANERKDRRYYEIVEDTIDQGFDYGYFALKNEAGEIRAIQPFFINDQDMLAGTSPEIMKIVAPIRRLWSRFLKMRTLMIGMPEAKGISTPGTRVPPSRREEPGRGHIEAGAPFEVQNDRLQGISARGSPSARLSKEERFYADSEHADDAAQAG